MITAEIFYNFCDTLKKVWNPTKLDDNKCYLNFKKIKYSAQW